MSKGYGARTQNYEEYMKDHERYERTKVLKGRRKTPKQMAEEIKRKNKALGTGLKDLGKEQFNSKVKETIFNEKKYDPREEVKYHLSKGDFDKAYKTMKDYDLLEEAEEFKEGMRTSSGRSEFSQYLKSKQETHYAGEELYSDNPNRYGDKMRKVNDFNKREEEASAKRVEDIFIERERMINNLVGSTEGRNLQSKADKIIENYRKKKSTRLGKGLNSLGKEKMSGKGVKDLFKR